MRIAALGTGPVGQAVAAKMAELGHEVTVGTRSVEAAMARSAPDNFGNPPFPEWVKQHPRVAVATSPMRLPAPSWW